MSEKKRQKKDGGRKDKKNERRRENENTSKQKAAHPQQARDASNLADTEPGGEDSRASRGQRAKPA